MSWSTNCPHCISISVYFSFSRDWELMVAVDTERGDGSPSDLGASTKPWDYQQKVCSCVKH